MDRVSHFLHLVSMLFHTGFYNFWGSKDGGDFQFIIHSIKIIHRRQKKQDIYKTIFFRSRDSDQRAVCLQLLNIYVLLLLFCGTFSFTNAI